MSRTALALAIAVAVAPSLALAGDQPGPAKSGMDQFLDWIRSLQPKPPPPKPEELPAKDTITANPLALDHQQLGIEYERALGDIASIYLSPQAAYGSSGSTWLLTAGLNVGMRFFVLGAAPNGLFFGPEFGVNYERGVQAGSLRTAIGIGMGGSVGLSLVIFNRFVVSVGFSAQYRTEPDLTDPTGVTIKTRFAPLPRLAFGVAF